MGLIRVSRVAGRAGESFISPQQQRDRIMHHAAAGAHTIIAWQEDLDQPGSRIDRPGLQAALEQVERKEADGIAVAKLDRFARSVAGAARALERLEADGGVLVAVDLGMDTSTPAGKLMRNVLMALAEFEVDRIRESWNDATGRAVARGVHVASKVVPGYRRGGDGRLELDVDIAPVVREAFRMRAANASWRTIQRFLDEQLPRDGKLWTQSSVISMLGSRTYLGETRQGAHINLDAHPALVTEEEWEGAQARYARPASRHSTLLLAGLIRCAGCGYTMTSSSSGARGYTNYRCRARHTQGDCPEPARISTLRADRHVTERFLEFAGDIEAKRHRLTVDSERALRAAEAAEAELVAYRDSNFISIIGIDSYRAGLEQRARVVDETRDRVNAISRRDRTAGWTVRLSERWHRHPEERRELLAAAIDAIFVRRAQLPGRSNFDGRLHICWAGDAPTDLPGRARTALRPFAFPNDSEIAAEIVAP